MKRNVYKIYSQHTVRSQKSVWRKVSSALRKHAQKPPNVLFHYTDGPGLLGILNTQCFWGTDIRVMNDMSEMKYAIRLFKELFGKRAAKGNVIAELLLHQMIDFISTGQHLYAVCFSELDDDLSQWRGYAGGVKGFSLGINFAQLPQFTSRISDEGDGVVFPMIYKESDQHVLLTHLIDAILDQLAALNAKHNSGAFGRRIASSQRLVAVSIYGHVIDGPCR